MRKQLIVVLILLSSVLATLECAWADDPPAAPAAPAAPVASAPAASTPTPAPTPAPHEAQGSLYRVQYQGHTSYLFGTIHVGKPEFYPLEPQVMQDLKDADALAVEFDIGDSAALQKAAFKYAIYQNFDTVDKHLSPKTVERLKKALATLGLPYEGLSHLKPWMIANELLLASLEKQGYPGNLATDIYFLNKAKEENKSIVSLESADFQLALFDKLTPKQQEAYLTDSLDDLESGAVSKKNDDLLNAWEHADEKTYESLLAEARNDKTESGRFFYRDLLLARNPAMTDKIAQLIKEHEHSFVAIGLLHLVGNEGVPQLLKKKGFEVEQVY